MEKLEAYVKSADGNMLLICKHIVAGGETNITEASFTKLATEAARLAFPNDRPDKAFSKYFSAHQVVREAHQRIVKATIIMPVFIGGQAAIDAADEDPSDALAQIEEIVRQQRARNPEMAKLSPAAAFAKVYCDPANARLAAAERRQNRPQPRVAVG